MAAQAEQMVEQPLGHAITVAFFGAAPGVGARSVLHNLVHREPPRAAALGLAEPAGRTWPTHYLRNERGPTLRILELDCHNVR